MLTGQNGILTQAQTAQKQTTNKSAEEKNFIKYIHQRILEAMKESLGINRFGRGYFYLYNK